MGLLSRIAGGTLRRTAYPALLGGAMGGLSSAGNGGDLNDMGRAALQGAAVGGLSGGLAGPTLGGIAGFLGGGTAGMMSTRGDVDAAARKIVAASRGDPNSIERAADLLYGARATREEMGYGRMGRSNRYGVSASDQVGMGAIGIERDAAVQRAYEMMGVQP